MNNDYLDKRYARIKKYLRFRLAVQQLISKPYLNIFWGMVLVLFAIFCRKKRALYIHAPKLILPAWRSLVCILGCSAFIFSLFFIIYMIGELVARSDEYKLVVAFSAKDLRNGYPILARKAEDKNTGVTEREFYSNIPMKRWKESKDEIADSMSVCFVKPEIEYGGKNKANGKRIVIYTVNGRIQPKRGILYEEE